MKSLCLICSFPGSRICIPRYLSIMLPFCLLNPSLFSVFTDVKVVLLLVVRKGLSPSHYVNSKKKKLCTASWRINMKASSREVGGPFGGSQRIGHYKSTPSLDQTWRPMKRSHPPRPRIQCDMKGCGFHGNKYQRIKF